MEASSSGPPRKRARAESTKKGKDKDDSIDNYDEALFHYYQSRAEHTVKIATEQITLAQKLDDEQEADVNRLCWKNIQGDDKRCLILTGFTTQEFIELLRICENDIPINIGRGKQSKFTQADKFLIVLCYVKHYETQAKLGENFSISKAQINRIISTTVPVIFPILYLKYSSNSTDHQEYEEFSDTLFVMDVTIQKIWKPLGNFQERKQYYSGKHKLYGLKTLTFHHRNGFVLACWSGVPGAVHDSVIANDNHMALKKIIENEDRMGEESKIFADKGFIGCEANLQVVIPYKKKQNKELNQNQAEYNKSLSSHRVICERWYGRLKGLFRIISGEYHNDRDDYEGYFKLCAALTNYHITKHPL